ncbi:hypothetical protein Ssi02_08090 [Sinosporangium siamense]|uniref:Uncharacterized protein n=1 Tax=Sinosporangium siamense TaxID=1367973 RepID=A0A919RBF4_9ACTN|nr:hypothetical protein Ssi02_08090 [Sinosporangium siamense]
MTPAGEYGEAMTPAGEYGEAMTPAGEYGQSPGGLPQERAATAWTSTAAS